MQDQSPGITTVFSISMVKRVCAFYGDFKKTAAILDSRLRATDRKHILGALCHH